MANVQRPSTSCQTYRPSLTDDNKQTNNNGKSVLHRSYTFDASQIVKQQQPPSQQQTQRLGRSLLSNDNWRQDTMGDLRISAKTIEQSDQNILYGKGKIELTIELILFSFFVSVKIRRGSSTTSTRVT